MTRSKIKKKWKKIKRTFVHSVLSIHPQRYFRLFLKQNVRLFFKLRKTKRNKPFDKFYKLSIATKLKFFLFGVLASFFFLFLPLVAYSFSASFPNLSALSINSIPKTTKIFDRNGTLLYEIYANQNRTVVKLSNVPLYLREATIAIEDKDFYQHPGFDLKAIMRAFLNNIAGHSLQGGSTITQQLIKSAFLTSNPTISRKIKEVVLAFLAERIYSKDKILELYFNFVPYGGTAWGVESASEIYFGKNVSKLDLAESSFLAGLPRAPSVYSPFNGRDPSVWKKRQKEVLDAMVRQRYISQIQENTALKEKLIFQNPQIPIFAPHFVMYVKSLLVQKYGLNEVERGGLNVITSLDLKTQQMAQRVVTNEVSNDHYLSVGNGAALITNPKNGDILAMVGSRDYFDQKMDGAVNLATSLRQPGSSIKIVTYSLALSNVAKRFTEATLLDDAPLSIRSASGDYTPVNYDGRYHGLQPLRYAFANSLNIPAVKVAQALGVSSIVHFGKEMGIESWGDPNQYGLSITLGAADVTMLDMARVYGTIANEGNRVGLNPFLRISDSDGNVLYQKRVSQTQVVDPGVAFIVSNILADNNARTMEFGPNSPLVIPGHRVSVKTGTSDNKRDNWTIGYTKNYVVTTWVGNNDNSPMSQTLASGITGAAPIWNKIMTNLLSGTKDTPIEYPADIVGKKCFWFQAYFLKGTEKQAKCSYPSAGSTPSPVSVLQTTSAALSQAIANVASTAVPSSNVISQINQTSSTSKNNPHKNSHRGH